MLNPGSLRDVLMGDMLCWMGTSSTPWVLALGCCPSRDLPQGSWVVLWVSLGMQHGQRAHGSDGCWVPQDHSASLRPRMSGEAVLWSVGDKDVCPLPHCPICTWLSSKPLSVTLLCSRSDGPGCG